jgi:hypothetical protein
MEDAMVIIRIIQVQFLLLLVFLLCTSIAGEKEGVFWFALTSLALGALFLAGKIAQSRH